MIFLYVVIALSLLFVLFFIHQLINAWNFLYSKKTDVKIEKNTHVFKKCVIKKKANISLSKKRIRLQSKLFYATFLKYKPYNKIPISIKFLVDDIYKKLYYNHHYFNFDIDYDRLLNADIFNGKLIYKIDVKSKDELEKQIKALSIVSKYIDFRTIFILDKQVDNCLIKKYIYENTSDIDCRIIFIKDINFYLLYEINKLNLNYKVEKIKKEIGEFEFSSFIFSNSIKWNTKEYYTQNNEIKITKFINTDACFKESQKGYLIEFDKKIKRKTIKFNISFELKEHFFNIVKNNKSLTIKYFNNSLSDEFFHFNEKIKNFEIEKIDGKIFIVMYFIFHLNTDIKNIFVISSNFRDVENISHTNIKNLIFKKNIALDKILKYNIYIRDNDFNTFFNKDLKKMIVIEKLEGVKFSLSYKIKKIIEDNFNIRAYTLINLNSYFNVYNFFISEFLGIKESNSCITLNPKKEYFKKSFKLVFCDSGIRKSLYICKNNEIKGLEVGEVFYTNLKVVDLTLINRNSKLCI